MYYAAHMRVKYSKGLNTCAGSWLRYTTCFAIFILLGVLLTVSFTLVSIYTTYFNNNNEFYIFSHCVFMRYS
jgi:hypothetical protein